MGNWSVMGGARMGRGSSGGGAIRTASLLGGAWSGLQVGSAGRNLRGVCSKFSQKGPGWVGLRGGALSSTGWGLGLWTGLRGAGLWVGRVHIP